MGWVEQRGKKYRLSFRYGGKMFRHSLGVETQREADESLSRVERNLRLLEEGILELPRGADLPLFLLSGGKLTAKPEIVDVVTLGGLVTLYMEAHVGAQESNTIYTTRIHAAHLKKTLGDDFSVQLLTTSDLPDSTGLQVLRCRVSGRRCLRHPSSYHRRRHDDGRTTEHPAGGS